MDWGSVKCIHPFLIGKLENKYIIFEWSKLDKLCLNMLKTISCKFGAFSYLHYNHGKLFYLFTNED